MIPKTRNAMKCLQGANSCLWPKSANGKVEIPFIISDAYGRFYFVNYYINGAGLCILTCLFHILYRLCYWQSTFIHNCRKHSEEYDCTGHEGHWIQNLHQIHSTINSDVVLKHWIYEWVSLYLRHSSMWRGEGHKGKCTKNESDSQDNLSVKGKVQ